MRSFEWHSNSRMNGILFWSFRPRRWINRIILKTVYSDERNRSKKCSFRKIHEPAILFAPRPTLPTNETVFGLLILLLDIPSNPLFSVRVFSFWNSPKRMPPKINRKWLLVLIDLRLKSNLCPKFSVCGYLYPLLYFRFGGITSPFRQTQLRDATALERQEISKFLMNCYRSLDMIRKGLLQW